MLGWAQKEYRRVGHYGLSVFADIKSGTETTEELTRRLLSVTELAGVDPRTNAKFFVCTQAEELVSRGFAFFKDGDDDELPEHYCVILGDDPDVGTVTRFLQPFGPAQSRGL